ncbi:DNA cytosine methyltransferase [Eggerthella sinensis]|uniref:DNA cytosine methyltransferase n=1 Tax=Eggerthella sinensis TaxID=242230 RepID=UPI001D067683|nr:DNA cytosine methyltransferase [Eggerthella sinensis]MCB7036258.1 DNA cytosine methyltransferase [Eggerthella sinensis]
MPIELINLLSIEDIAHELGVTKPTALKMIKNGAIGATKIGSSLGVRKQDLDHYIELNNLERAPLDHPREFEEIPDITALSFFSGALGLDLGMELAGIKPLLFCENDKKCRMTIQSMRPDTALIGDITDYDAPAIREFARIPENHPIDVVFGGPPCQAFSTAGARRAFSDSRGNVFLRYIELATQLSPQYLVIENVRGLLSASWPIKKEEEPVKGGALHLILSKLNSAGYTVSFNLYNAANFGAAQIRERVVLIAKKSKTPIPYLIPTHAKDGAFGLPPWKTFREAIQGLDEQNMHSAQFPEKRLRYFRMLKEGQYWKDLPLDMQKEAMGKSYSLPGGKTGFYRRISFDKPCPTLVTSPTMPATDLCHPTKDRPLSIEEYRRVQGFPDEWKIRGNLTDMYRQIGNAVPVALGTAIGKAIIEDISGKSETVGFKEFPYSRYKNSSDKAWLAHHAVR